MSKMMEDMREEVANEAVLNRDKEMITKKLRKGWSPARLREEDEYPMELIRKVLNEQKSLIFEQDYLEDYKEGYKQGFGKGYSEGQEETVACIIIGFMKQENLSEEDAKKRFLKLVGIL